MTVLLIGEFLQIFACKWNWQGRKLGKNGRMQAMSVDHKSTDVGRAT